MLGYNADTLSAQSGEPDDKATGELLVHLHEITVVHDSDDGLLHIIDFGWVVRDKAKKLLIHAVGVITGVHKRRLFYVVLR
ncbi:hypothetical protein ES703_113017 [subsurface metagenome]